MVGYLTLFDMAYGEINISSNGNQTLSLDKYSQHNKPKFILAS